MKLRLMMLAVLVCCQNLPAQEKTFAELVGNVAVAPVAEGVTNVPFLTWGGDVATFYANGGLETKAGSVYNKLGLKLKLTPGDDFIQQVRDYATGKSPYLRGTFEQVTQAADVIGNNPQTKPKMIMQLTWSAGDHIVARASLKSLNDLKGKKIALQQGGPHVGLLNDALKTAGLTWKDITVVWAKDLAASDLTTLTSPANLFRADKTIDAACVISTDMIGLCGGLKDKGGTAEGNVKDSHVLLSTAQMSRSIADVYCVRTDYFNKHQDAVEKFVAGYLKGSEDLMAMKKVYNDGKGKSPEYMAVLKLTQSIYGEKLFPTLEIDTHGLVSDATFVRLPGNISFFEDAGNLSGFAPKQTSALDLMIGLGLIKNRYGFDPPRLDWKKIATVAGITYVGQTAGTGRIKGEIDTFTEELDDSTIVTFVIKFEPNQNDFSADTYGAEFKRVIESASRFGNAVFAVRGHSDPTATLRSFLKAGMEKGIITRSGKPESQGGKGYEYQLRGKPLDLTQTTALLAEIQAGNFVGSSENPTDVLNSALNLSLTRAEQVKAAIVDYAKKHGHNLDESQIKPQGVGIREPVNPKPTSMAEAKENMRVEFRLIKVPAEAIKESDFDF